MEVAFPIVLVQPVAQRIVITPELVAAAHDVEILMAIAVGIEEDRINVLVQAVGT